MTEVLNEDALRYAHGALQNAQASLSELEDYLNDMSEGEPGSGDWEAEADGFAELLTEIEEWLEGEGYEEMPQKIRRVLRDAGRR